MTTNKDAKIKQLQTQVKNLTAETKTAKQENYDRYQKQLLAEENEKKAKAEVVALTEQLRIANQALAYAHAYMATAWNLQNWGK
jgi:hypothetical protein